MKWNTKRKREKKGTKLQADDQKYKPPTLIKIIKIVHKVCMVQPLDKSKIILMIIIVTFNNDNNEKRYFLLPSHLLQQEGKLRLRTCYPATRMQQNKKNHNFLRKKKKEREKK